jgi:hypothetical protein
VLSLRKHGTLLHALYTLLWCDVWPQRRIGVVEVKLLTSTLGEWQLHPWAFACAQGNVCTHWIYELASRSGMDTVVAKRNIPIYGRTPWYILSRVRVLCVTYKTGSGLDDWIYWHLIHTTRDYRQYGAISDLHTLQFTVTHALGFSIFTSRILATGL